MKDIHHCITADYRDGRVRLGGKTYAAGSYAVHLLNQYYVDDIAMRIALFRRDGEFLLEELSLGYLKEKSFIGAGEEIIYILNWLPKLKPFDKMDIDAERNRVNELFTEENRQQIMHFLRSRASISMQDDNVLALDLPVRMYDKELFE